TPPHADAGRDQVRRREDAAREERRCDEERRPPPVRLRLLGDFADLGGERLERPRSPDERDARQRLGEPAEDRLVRPGDLVRLVGLLGHAPCLQTKPKKRSTDYTEDTD